MKFIYAMSLFCALSASSVVAAPVDQDGPPVFTATRIYHTIVSTWPYLVDRTTEIVWTQYPWTSASVSRTTANVPTSTIVAPGSSAASSTVEATSAPFPSSIISSSAPIPSITSS